MLKTLASLFFLTFFIATPIWSADPMQGAPEGLSAEEQTTWAKASQDIQTYVSATLDAGATDEQTDAYNKAIATKKALREKYQ